MDNEHSAIGLTVTIGDDGVAVVSGELDAATAQELPHSLLQFAESPEHTITIDMAGLDFIDVPGLRALEEVGRQLTANGATLVLREPSRPVRLLLAFRRSFPTTEPWIIQEEK